MSLIHDLVEQLCICAVASWKVQLSTIIGPQRGDLLMIKTACTGVACLSLQPAVAEAAAAWT